MRGRAASEPVPHPIRLRRLRPVWFNAAALRHSLANPRGHFLRRTQTSLGIERVLIRSPAPRDSMLDDGAVVICSAFASHR